MRSLIRISIIDQEHNIDQEQLLCEHEHEHQTHLCDTTELGCAVFGKSLRTRPGY